jgi:hypothetical protein
MRPHQIENWALNVVERVESDQPIEDSRVELKSDWIDVQKAARRIAGHANASRGAPILWLIGVHETKGVVGAQHEELADWYEGVKAQFSGLAPQVSDYNIPVGDKTVVALLFQTDRVPFVVKNPVYGKQGGGPVELEVPWRENTSVRSATRSDLLRLLSPLQTLPSFEVLGGTLKVTRRIYRDGSMFQEHHLYWSLDLELYAGVPPEVQVVIPFHQCDATFEVPESIERTAFDEVSLQPPRRFVSGQPKLLSLTIDSTRDEVLIYGPGKLHLKASQHTPVIQASFENDVVIRASCLPMNADHKVIIDVELARTNPHENEIYSWAKSTD